MEKKLRSFLLKMLGTESYLGLVSNAYIRLIAAGKLKDKYPELFYLKELVQPGFTCVDIGANVGYYSVFLSKYSGNTGRVYAVEPVPLFARVFLKNTSRFAQQNITLYQCALGSEQKRVTLGTPMIDGVFRHGLTKVIEGNTDQNTQTYEVDMQVPDQLFASIAKIDFLKCDVEGYEVILFPEMMATLNRCKPIIQIEISTVENRELLIKLLEPIGYRPFKLSKNELQAMSHEEALAYESGDFYFKVSA
jgi:FkbM family methyltransferase